jgi:hypothetical protein
MSQHKDGAENGILFERFALETGKHAATGIGDMQTSQASLLQEFIPV